MATTPTAAPVAADLTDDDVAAIDRHSASVSGAAVSWKRAQNCMPRRTRSGSSTKAGLV